MADDDPMLQRALMVEWQLRRRGVMCPRVLSALLRVPRHLFVPLPAQELAYQDRPQFLVEGQTISQPFMVARMTEALALRSHERVLEVGTGSGYQAAVLAILTREVFTLERHALLADSARRCLESLGYGNVVVLQGDGSLGLPSAAPFDAILVAAAAPEVPAPLMEQLASEGRMIVPVGSPERQELVLVRREGEVFTRQPLERCVFVPLIGAAGWPEP